jgi:hypothetical protein
MAIRSPVPAVSKTLFKVSGEDTAFNQFQDQVLGILNAFMKKQGQSIGAAPQYTSASRPSPSGTLDGLVIRLKDPSTAEKLQVCLSDNRGAFYWVDIVSGPTV